MEKAKTSPVLAGAIQSEEIDFQPESTAGEAEIAWWWANDADMEALRVCHFQAEVAAGKALYLPERPSDQRVIAVTRKDGKGSGWRLAARTCVPRTACVGFLGRPMSFSASPRKP